MHAAFNVYWGSGPFPRLRITTTQGPCDGPTGGHSSGKLKLREDPADTPTLKSKVGSDVRESKLR